MSLFSVSLTGEFRRKRDDARVHQSGYSFVSFSQRGTNKPHNEDALLLNGKVHQGSVRESGVVETSQKAYFAIADGVSSGTNARTASRRLLELLQTRLSATATSASLMPSSTHHLWCRCLVSRCSVCKYAAPTTSHFATTQHRDTCVK